MTIRMTATEAKAKMLSLLDDVSGGEEVEITKHGKVVARLVPARGPHALEGSMHGIAWTTDPDDDLYSTGVVWDVETS